MNETKLSYTGRYYLRPYFGGVRLMIEHRVPKESPGTFELRWKVASADDAAYLDLMRVQSASLGSVASK